MCSGPHRQNAAPAGVVLTRADETGAFEQPARADVAVADVLDRQKVDLAEELGDEAARRDARRPPAALAT